MKTEVTMKRTLLGGEIRQRSKSEFFSANDLLRVGNLWRLNNGLNIISLAEWFKRKATKEFIKVLEDNTGLPVKQSTRGRDASTWVHPFLFIDLALAINPKIKLEVYQWLFDYLLKYRNNSGESYKLMTGALYANFKNKQLFHKFISVQNCVVICGQFSS